MLNFYDFIQVYVFTTNHHFNEPLSALNEPLPLNIVNALTALNPFLQETP